MPTALADCHPLILDLQAEVAERELHAARLGAELAARRRRAAASREVSGTDRRDPSLSFHLVFLRESARHGVCGCAVDSPGEKIAVPFASTATDLKQKGPWLLPET